MDDKVKAQARLIYSKYQTLLLNKRQCAEVLNMSFWNLEKLRKKKKAPLWMRVDKGRVMFEIHDISEWIEENKV